MAEFDLKDAKKALYGAAPLSDPDDITVKPGKVVLSKNIEQSDWTAGKSATTDEGGNAVAAIYPSDSTWAAEHVAPKMQGIDQSKLVPLLVKTILELEARITALEG